MRVLILGGTGEARALAAALHGGPDLVVTSSLAGRVRNPAWPVGAARVGGFGGVSGLVAYLSAEADVLIDATHPFARTISEHAMLAAAQVPVPLLALRRPGWRAGPDDRWTRVPDIATAAAAVATRPVATVLLTTGRRDASAFAGDGVRHYVLRSVEPAEPPLPPRLTAVLDRGPYTVEGETALMAEHDVGLLVTKDSGGEQTAAKLVAARVRDLEVIMVDRPALPAGVASVSSVAAAVQWVRWVTDRADAARADRQPG